MRRLSINHAASKNRTDLDIFIFWLRGGGDTPKSREHLHVVYQQMLDEKMEKIIDTIMTAQGKHRTITEAVMRKYRCT